MLFTFRIFEQLALALKHRGSPEFTILNVFFIIQDFWETCACPEIFRCIGYIFYYSGVLSNLRLPWKTELPWNFSLYWIYVVHSGVLRNSGLPWIYCIECRFFIIQDFWATCACSEKQSCPGIFRCTEIYFIILDFWGTCGCPKNRVCPENFQARGGGRPSRPPASYAYGGTLPFPYLFAYLLMRSNLLSNETNIYIFARCSQVNSAQAHFSSSMSGFCRNLTLHRRIFKKFEAALSSSLVIGTSSLKYSPSSDSHFDWPSSISQKSLKRKQA